MKPISRAPVNKARSAGKFRHNTTRTRLANINSPMRGGWRL